MDGVVFLEDDKWVNFKPLTWMRPVCLLRTGLFVVWEKVRQFFPPYEFYIHTRHYLSSFLRSCLKGKEVFINDFEPLRDKRVIFINGRALVRPNLATQILTMETGLAYTQADDFIAACLDPESVEQILPHLQNCKPLTKFDLQIFLSSAKKVKEIPDAIVLRYPWQLIDHNIELLSEEFFLATNGKESEGKFEEGTIICGGKPNKVFISKGAVVHPTVVLDVTHGPIYIGKNSIIYPPTRIEGPTYIGENSWIVGGKIREGSNIGDVCRVGGEVENSVIHGYSNKYHDGFLGHSYIGEWVNLGALTTNSDLKDTYGSVKLEIEGEGKIDAGMKVGCFIGDHVKTSIGSLIYTGKRIGIFSHIHGIVTEDVPSFTIWAKSFGADGDKVELLLESAIETHRRVLERRKIKASPQEVELIQFLFELTQKERIKADVRKGRPKI